MEEFVFPVFDESFYQKINDNYLIYKIYFKSHEKNSYIGKVFNVDKNFLTTLRENIWVTYFGLSYNEKNNNNAFVELNKFEKFHNTKRLRLEDLMKANRERMIEGLYSNCYIKDQVKYIKMFYFMELHNLKLSDLRFEIVYGYKQLLGINLSHLMWKEIIKDKTHLNGFNCFSITDKVFDDQNKNGPYCNLFFNDFEKNLNELITIDNVYEAWNIFLNFFIIFKKSFEEHIIYWLIYWKQLDFKTIKKQNEMISKKIIIDKISKDFFYKPILIRQLTHVIKEIENLDIPYGFNDLYFSFLNVFKLEKITFKNNKYLDIISGYNLKEIDFNFFIENEFKWFFFRYENWKTKYNNISKYLENFENISSFFMSNPFLNSIHIEILLNEVKMYKENFVYKNKNIYDEIDKYISNIYFGKPIKNKKYDFINNFYLKELHNIIIFILVYITDYKYNDFIVLDNVIKI